MSGEDAKATVRRMIDEVWNETDRAVRDRAIPTLVTPDRVESTMRNQAHFHATFGSFRRTLTEIVAEADLVMTRWTATAIHHGEYHSAISGIRVPATGREVAWTGMSMFRVADGKIAFNAAYWDEATLLKGLGIAG